MNLASEDLNRWAFPSLLVLYLQIMFQSYPFSTLKVAWSAAWDGDCFWWLLGKTSVKNGAIFTTVEVWAEFSGGMIRCTSVGRRKSWRWKQEEKSFYAFIFRVFNLCCCSLALAELATLGETTVLPHSELIKVSLPCSRIGFADRASSNLEISSWTLVLLLDLAVLAKAWLILVWEWFSACALYPFAAVFFFMSRSRMPLNF